MPAMLQEDAQWSVAEMIALGRLRSTVQRSALKAQELGPAEITHRPRVACTSVYRTLDAAQVRQSDTSQIQA